MSCCGKGRVPPEYGLAIITTGRRVPLSVASGRRTWMRMRSSTPSRSESSPGISTQTLCVTIGCPAKTGCARPSTNCCANAGAVINAVAAIAPADAVSLVFIIVSSGSIEFGGYGRARRDLHEVFSKKQVAGIDGRHVADDPLADPGDVHLLGHVAHDEIAHAG